MYEYCVDRSSEYNKNIYVSMTNSQAHRKSVQESLRVLLLFIVLYRFKNASRYLPDSKKVKIQNSEQYDVIFLIDNDVDERHGAAARAYRGNYDYISALRNSRFAIGVY